MFPCASCVWTIHCRPRTLLPSLLTLTPLSVPPLPFLFWTQFHPFFFFFFTNFHTIFASLLSMLFCLGNRFSERSVCPGFPLPSPPPENRLTNFSLFCPHATLSFRFPVQLVFGKEVQSSRSAHEPFCTVFLLPGSTFFLCSGPVVAGDRAQGVTS